MKVFLGFLIALFLYGFLLRPRKGTWVVILGVSLVVCFAYFFLNQI